MFKFLINTWLMLLFPMFAAGAVADVAAGDSADLGGGDADTPADQPDTADTGGVEADAEGTGAEQVETTEVQPDAKTDGRTLSPQLRKVLAETKAANPEAYKQLKGVVFSEQAFRQQFPKGPQEAAELRAKLEEIGGFEAVEEIQTEVQDYRGMDQQFLNGDPAFIQTAVATYPEGFKKLMPSMIQTYANVDKEGFNRELSKIMVQTFDSAQLPQTLMWAKRLLGMSQDGNAKEALAQLEGIEQWLGGLRDLSAKAPALPQNDPKTQELSQREQAIQQREHQQFIAGVGATLKSYAEPKILAELKQLAPKGIPEGAQNKIILEVRQELSEVLGKDRAFSKKYDDLCNAHDHDGAWKLLKSKLEARGVKSPTLLADATKKVYRTWYGEPKLGSKPKPATNGSGQPAAKAPQGWTRVAKPPNPDDVNSMASRGLIFHSQAVLKSGQKVYWGDKVPS